MGVPIFDVPHISWPSASMAGLQASGKTNCCLHVFGRHVSQKRDKQRRQRHPPLANLGGGFEYFSIFTPTWGRFPF